MQTGNPAYAEYNGAVYYAGAYSAGDVNDVMPTGCNPTAATFLSEHAQAVAIHKRNVPENPT